MIAYQLEYLERCGFNEVLVVTRHSKTLEKYLKTDYKGKIMIETIELNEESTNNVEALKQISNKINRDFIVIPCDLICDISLDDVVDQHIITQATVTMVFREEEKKATNTKKEASKEVKEENNDYDVVVVDQESNRVLQIMNNTDVENEGLKLKKILLAKHPHSTISTNLFDCHLYIFNYKVLEFLKKCKRKFWNIKDDFLPFLIENQYNIKLSKEFFEETPRNEDFLYMNSKLKGEEKKTQFVSVYGFISQNNYCKRTNIIKEYMQANLDFFLKPPNLPDCLISSRNNEPEIKEKKFENIVFLLIIVICFHLLQKICRYNDWRRHSYWRKNYYFAVSYW